MKTLLSFKKPADLETECLVAVVLDHGEKEKPAAKVAGDAAIAAAAADAIRSGEMTGKAFESVLLHRPQGLKAKRLLLLGGGPAKDFSAYELRLLAGAAARALKPKSIRGFAFAAPKIAGGPNAAVRAIVEGAFVGNFDPDTYKSDRKDQSIAAVTVVAPAGSNPKTAGRALEEARILGESQTFTASW